TGVDTGQVVRTAHSGDVLTRQTCNILLFVTAHIHVLTICFATGNCQFATRSHQVEFGDSEAEHHVVNHEEHQTLRDQHPPVSGQRVTGRENHIHQTCTEAEACNPVH